MNLFSLLGVLHPDLSAASIKVHLATWNGEHDPLDVYLAGDFDEWQSWQNKRNFGRPFVLALIAIPQPRRWLFAGLYRSYGAEWIEAETCYRYDLRSEASCQELAGRLVVDFARPSRQSYIFAENWAERMLVSEIYAEALSVSEFPGFRAVELTNGQLKTICRHAPASWRTALSSVAGVYLISDTASGKLYVGSAYGAGGFWQRWQAYAATGHGGNRDIFSLLRAEGMDRVDAFKYSILEIADIHTDEKDIIAREQHWKSVLLSRMHGLNAN